MLNNHGGQHNAYGTRDNFLARDMQSYGGRGHGYSEAKDHGYERGIDHGYKEARDHGYDKDPHRGYRDTHKRESKSSLVDILLHYPIQYLEQQLQFLAASKVDNSSIVNAVVSDFEFRWLGLRTMTTIFISLSSLIAGILVFLGIALFSGNVIASYLMLLMFLSHTLFPGYIVQRMKRYVAGPDKTGRFMRIVRKTWLGFEIFYVLFAGVVLYVAKNVDWSIIKEKMINFSNFALYKKYVSHKVADIPIEYMGNMLTHMSFILLATFLIYIILMRVVNNASIKEREVLNDALDKEILRPAEIAKKKSMGV